MDRRQRLCIALFLVLLSLVPGLAWAGINGSISGLVTDATGAVVSGAAVTATNTQTGVQSKATTDARGFYDFPSLLIGTYEVAISQAGFKTFHQTGLAIDANSALRVDAVLQIGATTEKVEVSTDSVHVETESTQMGEVISGKTMTAVPLNGRSFTDLLALQPGVSPYIANDTGSTVNDRPVDGGLNSGNQSVNGQREASNGFMVNGSNVEEGKNNGAAIIPNLDSIEEFRIITNNFDAEYGNYSGGQINVVTKSGTNAFHGSAFEFFRNPSLNATEWYATAPADLHRNQFGGTFGGPIRKNSTFFFVDYQGWRETNGETINNQVPSKANFGGMFQDRTFSNSVDSNGNPVAATISSEPAFESLLATRLGYSVNDGEPFYSSTSLIDPTTINSSGAGTFYATNCTTSSQCVFPNAIIPNAAWSPVATAVLNLGLIPQPNAANDFFATSKYIQTLRDDKGGFRIDQNTHFGMLFGYYFLDDYTQNSPYPNANVNAVPAQTFDYNGITTGRAQMINLGDNKNFGAYSVNEFRFSFVRNVLNLTSPQGGVGPNYSLSTLGFKTPWTNPAGGISPVAPSLEGVPTFQFNSFAVGVPIVSTRQYNNSFQVVDNFSRVIGTHSIKFGGQFHYDQINERNYTYENGGYTFDGSETGIDFADFLIGAPSTFTQATPQLLDSRTKYYGLFAQDSWRVTSNLVFNYGLRWEASLPWYDTQNKTETIIPGLQSVKFPGAPLGYVVAGDKGVPRTLAPTQWHNFSPRLGLAYSPSTSDGLLGKLFGGPGRTSIRVGAGMYYTSVEDLSQFLEVGDPPYGLYFGSYAPPLLEAPFSIRATGAQVSGWPRFPFPFPPTNVSPSNPDTSFNWPGVEPLSYDWSFNSRNKLPYSEHYELSIQRQIGTNTVATVSYVGNQGHRLVSAIEANPANPALCLYLSNAANLDPSGNTTPCGPFAETPSNGPWITLPGPSPFAGQTFQSSRLLGPLFDTNPFVSTVANSRYHSLQASLSHNTGSLSFLAGYTFSKCMDNSSSLQDSTNPFNPRLSQALCLFDVTQHLVFSYNWLMPFDRLTSRRVARMVIGGWSWSGVTTFATGLPIGLSENDDNSLIGAIAAPVDVPNFTHGKVLGDTNPRHGNPYFNTSLFSVEQLGQFGTSRRSFFHGPGLNNFDTALSKTLKFTETKEFQLRFEAFNVFNHAQFNGPNGLINSGTFGMVTSARDPRILQIGAKFLF